MELRFPIFGSAPDEYGNAIPIPIQYYNRKDYYNKFGIDPLLVKATVANSKWFNL